MLAIQQPRPLPVPVFQRSQMTNHTLPPLSELQEGTGQRRYSYNSRVGSAASQAPIPGLRTPPLEMDVNPLLAPHYGPVQYKGVPVVASNTSSYHANKGSIGNTKYISRAQPLLDSYQPSHRSQSSATVDAPIDGFSGARDQSSRRRNSDGSEIVHYLQIPSSINDSKGSLAEFTAQITCLFWFESSTTLQLVEESRSGFDPQEPLLPEAMPTSGFRKWVTTILSTTQVTQNVVLLALMFIHRLKRLNPGVKGKLGSEFRLLTVALMLGNKFLDDNTYTNKTWAEVSGISVQEIHIMEVEFLSNMRYTLYVSDSEWDAWHVKLGRFWNYFAKASKGPVDHGSKRQGFEAPSLNLSPHLPSPPGSNHTSPPFCGSHSFTHQALPHPLSMAHLPPSAPSPTMQTDTRPSTRKRSREDNSYEPASKRPALPSSNLSVSSSTTATPSTIRASASLASCSTNTTPSTIRGITSGPPRLPMPNLSIFTNSHPSGNSSTPGAQLPPPSIPSTGQVSSASRWSHGTHLPSLPQPSPYVFHSGTNPTGSSDWQSRPSPYGSGSVTPSPTNCHFPQSQHTPTHLSPASFPPPRYSPYKPVRGVNTLLVPPPSGSLQNRPENVTYDQIHYQPLGKPVSERRTGTLPYVHHAWAQPPPLQGYYLPHPNPHAFHQSTSESRVR